LIAVVPANFLPAELSGAPPWKNNKI